MGAILLKFKGAPMKKDYIGMDKVREILRLKEQDFGQTAIARACSVTRATVRDYIRIAAAQNITYAQLGELSEEAIKELFGKKNPGRKIIHEPLDFIRFTQELQRKGVTLQLLWEEYLRDHPKGYSYSNFCNRYRSWKKQRGVTMRQEYRAGEKSFVDWVGMKVEIVDRATGEISLASIFVMALGYSNYTYAEALPSEEISHWIGAHIRAFEFFGGVTEVLVPDNLKTGVTDVCRYEPGINRTYQELAEHYNVAVIPARSKCPRDKAKVEEAVQNVERRILAPLRDRTFFAVSELNEAIKPLLAELNAREMQTYKISRIELFEKQERSALRHLPKNRFELASWKTARVNIDYHVEFRRHYYSVPFQLVHETVQVRVTEGTIEIFHAAKRVASHLRSDKPGKHTTLKEHMPQTHQFMQDWSPSRLTSWAAKIGPHTKIQVELKLSSRLHPEQAYRACLGLLSLAKKYGNERLEAACQKVNSFGPVPLKNIKSVLERGTDKLEEKQPQSTPLVHANIRGSQNFH